MADQAITGLPVKTKSRIAATDYMLGIDSAEGYQMLIKDLGDYIIQTVQSSLMGSNQTLAAALNALNSNLNSIAGYINTGSYNDIKRSGLFVVGPSASDGPSANITCALINITTSIGASASGSSVKQIALPVATENSVYFRHFVGGSWSAWVAHSL